MRCRAIGQRSLLVFAAIAVTAVILAGCAGGINYSFDPGTDFSGLKRYEWKGPSAAAWQNGLIEKNVRHWADQYLAAKGLVKTSERSDLLLAVGYEYEVGAEQYGYQLRTLTLYAYRAATSELLWKGTAYGTIDAGSASDQLRGAVEGILSSLPSGTR